MTALITGHTERGQKYFVAHCHELPITTSGDTMEEAVARQPDAALAYLSALKAVDPQQCAELLQQIHVVEYPPEPDSSEHYTRAMPEIHMAALADFVA